MTEPAPMPGLIGTSTPIRGYVDISFAELRRRLPKTLPFYSEATVAAIIQAYLTWTKAFGLRLDVVFAQMLLETGSLTFGADVKPEQYNFAGLGATGDGAPGNAFTTPEAGVIAHCAHLAAYAYPMHVLAQCSKLYDPRHPETHWNTVKCLADLGGPDRWCPDTGYGAKVVQRWSEG